MRGKLGIDAAAELVDRAPLRLGVRLGDARRLAHALDPHLVRELHLALLGQATQRRGARGLGGAGERNMAFARKQAGGRIEPDPARAGQVGLAPGVQIGEVVRRSGGPVQRLDVRSQLNQVTRDETRGDAEVAQQLHQEPARVAARAAGERKCFFRSLHARFHADQIAHVLRQLLVEVDEEIVGLARLARNLVQVSLEQRRRRQLHEVGRELVKLPVLVLEREFLGAGLEEVVERVDDRHLGHQIHLDRELARLLREHEAREPVGLRILLPVDEVLLGQDPERVGVHRRARMRRGPQAHHLRAERDRPVVAVTRDVVKRDVNRHGATWMLIAAAAP